VKPIGRDVEQARGIARMDGPLGYQLVGEVEVEEIDAHLRRVQYDAMAEFSTRPATVNDAAAIARVFSSSLRLLTFLPKLHTDEEDRAFVENVVLKECAVTVAEAAKGIVAFLAQHGEEVRFLYTHPDFIGAGAGSLLIDIAKQSGETALELWCFQANVRARRFYERHGFKAIQFTDGRDNEEKTPDVLYRWQR
jgi:GNAT superfamily N-acetyltransferase